MRAYLLLPAFAATVLGCTLYKSSDRDYFNSSAAANAPTRSSRPLVALASECQTLPAGNVAIEPLRIDRSSTTRAIVTVTAKKHDESLAICRFEFDPASSDTDLQMSSQALVETLDSN